MKPYTIVTMNSYDSTAEEYAANVSGLLPKKDFERFTSYLLHGARILDLGCGSGVAAKSFSERGYHPLGIDISKRLLKIAKATAPSADFARMDVSDLAFADDSFGAAWDCACLLHIAREHLPQVLNGINRVIEEGGIFYTSFKKGEGSLILPDERYHGMPKQRTFLDEHSLRDLLWKSGFQVIHEEGTVTSDVYNPKVEWMSFFCRK